MTNAPAGWYPDTEQPGNERWWDGTQWTEQRRPGIPAVPAPAPYQSAAAQPLAPAAPQAGANAQKPLWKRTWFIVTAAVVALIVVGSVSGAIAGGKKTDAIAVADTTPVASPTPTPAQTSSAPSPTPSTPPVEAPAPAAVDPTFFKANAGKQLDDYAKDLSDLSDAVAKGSTLRVMSNSIELAFNEGELAAIAPTTNIAPEWTTALAGLSITTTQIADAISKKDYTTVNNLVGQANQQVASLRDIASRAA